MYSSPRRVALKILIDDLDAACCGSSDSFDTAVSQALGRACRAADLLTPTETIGSAGGYTRHLLHADPGGRYTLVALVWQPGQFSPIHGHFAWCGYAVSEGRLSEISYAYAHDTALAQPLHSIRRSAGSTCFAHAGLDDIHRLGNDGARNAISLHAYGVDSARVATHVNRVVQVAMT